jgi:hypothetical protein
MSMRDRRRFNIVRDRKDFNLITIEPKQGHRL